MSMSSSSQKVIRIKTRGRGLVDVTDEVRAVVRAAKIEIGLCSIFIQHTSASLVIQENADPSVLRDLERFADKLAPEDARYEHDAEGPDDMPAHLKSAVTRTNEIVPIVGGELGLGTWQAIYLWEHRRAPHERKLVVTILG
jgi:secondary thiamine-phosphate synthase enzyme